MNETIHKFQSWIRKFSHILTSTVKEYCEGTTIHGFSYCVAAGKMQKFLNEKRLFINPFRKYPSSNRLDIGCALCIYRCIPVSKGGNPRLDSQPNRLLSFFLFMRIMNMIEGNVYYSRRVNYYVLLLGNKIELPSSHSVQKSSFQPR